MFEGYIDRVENGRVYGWAWQSDRPNEPISVDLYVDGEYDRSTIASRYRRDLEGAGKADGSHAFELPLAKQIYDGKTHFIQVRYHDNSLDLCGSPTEISLGPEAVPEYAPNNAQARAALDERVLRSSLEKPADHPRVSVIIPCYNLGQYIDEAVDSVLEQTYQNCEIIVVNDGSSDPLTNRVLTDYNRPKVRVVQAEHRGVMHARNLAIENAVGDYLCALDADDKLEHTYFQKAVQILDQDESLAFVSCWLKTFGDEDWVWRQDRCDLLTLLGECTVATPSLARRSAVLAVGGYDSEMPEQGYEDWDLWLSLVERGFLGTIIPEVLFFYRRRGASVSRACEKPETHLRLMRYMVEKHHSSYKKHLLDLLIRKENESCNLLRSAYAKEQQLETSLITLLRLRREELDRLKSKLELEEAKKRLGLALEKLEGDLMDEWQDIHKLAIEREEFRRHAVELDTALKELASEVRALRNSRSWKITAPFRTATAWLAEIIKLPVRGIPWLK